MVHGDDCRICTTSRCDLLSSRAVPASIRYWLSRRPIRKCCESCCIGGVEIDHFSLWHDKMGNAFAQPVAPLMDPVTGLNFVDMNNPVNQHNNGLSAADKNAGGQMFQTNLILPEPCEFLKSKSAGMLDHPSGSVAERRAHGHGQGLYRRQSVLRSKSGVPGSVDGPGVGCRGGEARGR